LGTTDQCANTGKFHAVPGYVHIYEADVIQLTLIDLRKETKTGFVKVNSGKIGYCIT
jgi:hypothetical protein